MRMRRRLLAALGFWVCIASPAAAESQASKVERLEHEVDELKREIQELKRERKEESRPVTPAPQAQAPVTSAPPAEEAAAKPGPLERVQIGGYGSLRFEANSAREENATFTPGRVWANSRATSGNTRLSEAAANTFRRTWPVCPGPASEDALHAPAARAVATTRSDPALRPKLIGPGLLRDSP